MRAILLILLRTYQVLLSPLLPNSCRFTPTCSQYMFEAVRSHGPAKGILMGLNRLRRCHPFNSGGHDPVPTWKNESS